MNIEEIKKHFPHASESTIRRNLDVCPDLVPANKLRYAHWTKASKSGRRAREAWKLSLASSPVAAANLTTMAMSLRSNLSEMQLRQAIDAALTQTAGAVK